MRIALAGAKVIGGAHLSNHRSHLRSLWSITAALAALVVAGAAGAATLPGFHITQVATTTGFCSSLAVDSHGIIYYTSTAGGIYRLDATAPALGDSPAIFTSTRVAQVPTVAIGNAGLLGMALEGDTTAVVHYTKSDLYGYNAPAFEVVSKIDLTTGTETPMAQVPDDITLPGRAVPNEHHGGNPAVGSNGDVYVGIGDFAAFAIAASPDWYAGKILRVDQAGNVAIVASGFRNPFGLSWDAANRRLIVVDNGDVADDEINIVTSAGGFFGWPYTMGNLPPYPGSVPPIYTFPKIVAPTGMTAVNGKGSWLRSGYLFTAFVTRAIYYVPDIDARPLPDPIPLIEAETAPLIDVAQGPTGAVYFASGTAIFRLTLPLRGDCNGDGVLDSRDMDALSRELADGDPHATVTAQDGSFAGSWGCDANGDGLISAADRDALGALIRTRTRAVRIGR